MELLFLILGFLIIITVYIFYAYNRLTRLSNTADTEWANIDVYLKKRADLIPNIIEVVKGYARHEKDVLESLSRARAQAMETMSRSGNEESNLSSHVRTIMALKESYPDLKANTDFLHLQEQLWLLEDEIAKHRHNFNDIVKEYNDHVLAFPTNAVAAMTGFSLMDLFEFTGSRDAPQLNLNTIDRNTE